MRLLRVLPLDVASFNAANDADELSRAAGTLQALTKFDLSCCVQVASLTRWACLMTLPASLICKSRSRRMAGWQWWPG